MESSGSSLIVVADGGLARLYAERRRGGPLIDLGTERRPKKSIAGAQAYTGSTHDRLGGASHRGDRPTPTERGERAFLDLVADKAADIVRRDGHEAAILIAPPRALGRLRERMARAGVAVAHADPHDRVSEDASGIRVRLRALRLGD